MKMTARLEGALGRATSFVERSTSGRFWDWQAVFLAIALIQLSSTRLVISEWVPSLEITQTISLYAVILGLSLGFSTFTRMSVLRLAFAYGALLIPMQLLHAVEGSRIEYNDLIALFFRLLNALDLFIRNSPVEEPLFFIFLTSIGFWHVGTYAGYRLIRHQSILEVILAPGLIMLIIQIYDPWIPSRAWGLAFYIFLALVLLGRMHYLENKAIWLTKNVFISSETGWEFLRSVLSTAAIIVLIAWLLPGALTSMAPAARVWRKFTEPFFERLSSAVSALDSPYGTSTGDDFYGTDLKLIYNAPTNDAPVFFVEVEEPDIYVLRYYWRGHVYNQYKNGRWTSTGWVSQKFHPETDEIEIAYPRGRSQLTFKFTMNFPSQDLLYAPSLMLWVNRDSTISVNSPASDPREVTAWLADPGLVAGDVYEVRTSIAHPTIQDLRTAGTEYPQWIKATYLQVPPEVETQLKGLAERIAAPHLTPFDKAQAITSFLRREIRYGTKIAAPPPGQDPVMWVLFEYKKGFCMYYASAEVLMLRTLGIPARLAVGFAQGKYDEDHSRYRVARLDSHAWPEVYFPGIGWVEFEPTSNQDTLIRPQAEARTSSTDDGDFVSQNSQPVDPDDRPENTGEIGPDRDENASLESNRPGFWGSLPRTGLALALSALGIYLMKRFSLGERLPVYLVERYGKSGSEPPHWLSNWAIWSNLPPIERDFHIINLSLRWLGKPQPLHTTPSERAQLLAKMLPAAKDAIRDLMREYQTALFTPRAANLSAAQRASRTILYVTLRTRIFKYRENLKRRYN